MKHIELTYHPFSFLPWQKKLHAVYPERWSELKAEQLQLIALPVKAKSDIQFLNVMTGIKKRYLKKLDDYQRYNLNNLLSFISDSPSHDDFIIKSIKPGYEILYAPKPLLKGMTFGQFIFVDTHFNNYQQEKQEIELYRFLAALYLPMDFAFKENIIDVNYEIMKALPRELQEAIIINYVMIKQWLIKRYPLLFISPEPDPDNDKKPSQKPDPLTWVKTFEHLVGDDIIHENSYAGLPLHNVFRYLSRTIKNNMKTKNNGC